MMDRDPDGALPQPTQRDAREATQPTNPRDPQQICKDCVTIVIDPGHGDKVSKKYPDLVDSGAVWSKGKLMFKEKDIALAVSKAVQDKLKPKPHVKDVILTRYGDVTQRIVRWKWRTDVAQSNNAQIFITIHVNSLGKATASGHIVAYWFPSNSPIWPESKKLATAVDASYKTIVANGNGVRGTHEHYGLVTFNPPGSVKSAIFIELGFITNDDDRAKLTDSATVQTIGGEIADGVAQYISDNISILLAQ